jgi:bacteriocin biosynthesis cyclodehydratase domain-containing protein
VTHERGSHAVTAGGPRYRLRPSVEPFVDAGGALYLVRPGAPDLAVRDAEPVDVAIVERLVQAASDAPSLLRALRADGFTLHADALDRKLASLVAADVAVRREAVADPLTGTDAERFARQLPYLEELGDADALQRRLRAATVAVIGCGGLGTWTIAALACLGVGRLVLVDDDVVELVNLNRQVLFRPADLGVAKVDAAASWVRAFDPAIDVVADGRRVAGPEDARAVVDGADAVVLVADTPAYEIGRWVNAACVPGRIPFVVAGQLPPIVKIGPVFAPGAGPCFACHETALRRASPKYDEYVAWRRDAPLTASTLGPASAVIGGLIGTELLHLLAGVAPATLGEAVILDLRTLALRRERIPRDPGCAACEHLG